MIKIIDLIETMKMMGSNVSESKLIIEKYSPELKKLVDGNREMLALYATALSNKKEIKNILEIGTGLGRMTNYLSQLFPDSTIHTIDLPKNDDNFGNVSYRAQTGLHQTFIKNIDRENIISHQINTFNLPKLDLPENFDLIYVDGGHQFPEVSWDTMFSYHKLSDKGDMFFHDYSTNEGVTAVKPTIEYISKIIAEDILILPSSNEVTSKIAWIRR